MRVNGTMGRIVRGDDKHSIQIESALRRVARVEMPEVNRIERPPEHAQSPGTP
jgi:hypothetical protein